MEKNTVLAIVLSIVVIVGFYIFQAQRYPQNVIPDGASALQTEQKAPAGTTVLETGTVSPAGQEIEAVAEQDTAPVRQIDFDSAEFPEVEELTTIETPLFIAKLTNQGGDLTSFKLKKHNQAIVNVDSVPAINESANSVDMVDMILSGTEEAHAFSLAFGAQDAKPIRSYFAKNRVSDYSVEFYRDFIAEGKKFRLTKTYNFIPDEYMFELLVSIDGGAIVPPLNFSGAQSGNIAYTIHFGPQIGPKFAELDERSEYRHFFSYINGKQKQEKVNEKQDAVVNARFSWAAIAGKYFTFFAVPDTTPYQAVFSVKPSEDGINGASRIFLLRSTLNASRTTDTYRFYLGPKTQDELAKYDNGANAWGYTEMRMEKIANASGFWGILNPLERLLKWLLNIFYMLVPNYGIAIILVTLLVKVLLFPLTKKSSEGTIRMQAMAPKIKEIQDKYKENPQKLQMEMGALYKREGYNPISGCLPMLVQLPIFLAMYNLFNNHFELRGALFISGWIPDLSSPETIWNFAPFRIPILGWSDLRLLPFVYVGSQLLYSKVTTTPDQMSNPQMKMMMYAMPLIFFFVLYNVPSGLLIYWIMSNVLTLFQQLMINKMMAPQKAAMAAAAAAEAQQKKAPHKNKKRK
ncbi:MAG: membrane protein insertase YidC [Termitinemataceae bacterium]|nr:MAG: membrane protein insertase YidC [Termitinemataceae bacterium]